MKPLISTQAIQHFEYSGRRRSPGYGRLNVTPNEGQSISDGSSFPDKSPTAAGRGDRSRKRSKGRLNTEVGLRSAIDRGEFFVEYQHLVSLCDNSIADVETLVRWEHPLRGRIGPHQLTPEITENSENSVTHDIELSISVFEGLRRWGAARTLGG